MNTQMTEHAKSALDTSEQLGVVPKGDLESLRQLKAIADGGDHDP